MSEPTRTPLPVVSCDGCGKCCETQGTPPGHAIFFPSAGVHPAEFIDFVLESGDLPHFRGAPDEAVTILRDYFAARDRGEVPDRYDAGLPCLWYDTEVKRCRFHEHRPQVCREFEVGGFWCRNYRDELLPGEQEPEE